MAKKYNPTATTNLTGLSDWLNENKTGTIFENATISIVSNKLNIVLNQSTVILSTAQFGASGGDIVTLQGGTTDRTWRKNGSGIVNFNQCVLSNAGLIIELSVTNGSNYVAIFIDSNDKLSVVWGSDDVDSVPITKYVGVSISSINLDYTTITPQYNANLTSLALITPTTGDNTIYFPNAYVAVATQLPGIGIYIVTINDTVYITNGIWYIPD